MEELQLQNNCIDNVGAETLLATLKGRPIKKLDVDNNEISGKVLGDLMLVLPVMKLHLVRNKITDLQMMPIR